MLASYYNCIFQVKAILDELLEKLPEEFNMMELHAKAEEKTPYILVALQECERMNSLIGEIRRSLKELDLGLKVREERHISEFSGPVATREAIRKAAWNLQGFCRVSARPLPLKLFEKAAFCTYTPSCSSMLANDLLFSTPK